jgi:hypothetical protein
VFSTGYKAGRLHSHYFCPFSVRRGELGRSSSDIGREAAGINSNMENLGKYGRWKGHLQG